MDMKMKLEYICDMSDKLIKELKVQMDGNLQGLNASEAGEIADIIKDFAESEKNYYEAQYYKSVVDAMETKNSPAMARRYNEGYDERMIPRDDYRPRYDYLEGDMRNDPNWNASRDMYRDAYREGDRRMGNYDHRMLSSYREGMYGPRSQMGAMDTYLQDPNVASKDIS